MARREQRPRVAPSCRDPVLDGAARVARTPLVLLTEGPLPLAALEGALRGTARPAAAAVVAFLRRALREKVLRDALHFSGVVGASAKELRGEEA